MKSIRQLHLYLGCIFAPLLVVFALTGALQTYELHETPKNGAYVAPKWLQTAAYFHKHQVLTKDSSPVATRVFIAAMSLSLGLTMILGVILAFKYSRSSAAVIGCLALGIALPLALLWLA